MRSLAVLAAIGLASFLAPAVQAAPVQACPAQFLGGALPTIDRAAVASSAVELCNKGYAVVYSPLTNGPIAAAEHLTRDQLQLAMSRQRDDAFHADDRLGQAAMRLSDFQARGSCLDRGHMANDKDQGTPDYAYETYNLSNMVPQDTDNNERLWEGIESAVRSVTMRYGETYVVTGPIFEGATIQRLNGKIAIPTKLFKAFYVPSQNMVGVYVTSNSAGDHYWSLSVDQLRQITGIDVFPALPASLRTVVMAQIPAPESHFHVNRETQGHCTPVAVGNGQPPMAGGAPAGAPMVQGTVQPRQDGTGGGMEHSMARAGMNVLRDILR